jgi:hypothetical protein
MNAGEDFQCMSLKNEGGRVAQKKMVVVGFTIDFSSQLPQDEKQYILYGMCCLNCYLLLRFSQTSLSAPVVSVASETW